MSLKQQIPSLGKDFKLFLVNFADAAVDRIDLMLKQLQLPLMRML